jgi:hypothetical protein
VLLELGKSPPAASGCKCPCDASMVTARAERYTVCGPWHHQRTLLLSRLLISCCPGPAGLAGQAHHESC